MFNMFPFNLGKGFSFNSFTSFTGSNGVNFFANVSGYYGMNNSNNNNYNYNNEFDNSFFNGFLNGLNSGYNSGYNNVLNGIDTEALEYELGNLIRRISDNFNQTSNEYSNNEEKECTFIKFEEFQDMYVLKIDLTGIDLRELSIKYNPGIIEINLKRAEIVEDRDYSGYENKRIVKKTYNKIFNEIEDIDLSRVLKSIDSGSFNMKMPKKYVIEKGSNVIEVDKYIVEDEKKELEDKI